MCRLLSSNLSAPNPSFSEVGESFQKHKNNVIPLFKKFQWLPWHPGENPSCYTFHSEAMVIWPLPAHPALLAIVSLSWGGAGGHPWPGSKVRVHPAPSWTKLWVRNHSDAILSSVSPRGSPAFDLMSVLLPLLLISVEP